MRLCACGVLGGVRVAGDGVLCLCAAAALLLASRTDGGILLPLIGPCCELIIICKVATRYTYSIIAPI